MRIEEIIDCGPEVKVTLKAARAEMEESHWHWHDEVQFVHAGGVVALLEEAAKRLNESDCGDDWSRASQLRHLAAEIKRYEAIDEIANKHADKVSKVFARRFEVKKGGEK